MLELSGVLSSWENAPTNLFLYSTPSFSLIAFASPLMSSKTTKNDPCFLLHCTAFPLTRQLPPSSFPEEIGVFERNSRALPKRDNSMNLSNISSNLSPLPLLLLLSLLAASKSSPNALSLSSFSSGNVQPSCGKLSFNADLRGIGFYARESLIFLFAVLVSLSMRSLYAYVSDVDEN